MIRIHSFVVLFALVCVSLADAQERTGVVTSRKQASAIRVADGSVRVDGRLDDEVWNSAEPITDFVQKEPQEGAAPSEQTEV